MISGSTPRCLRTSSQLLKFFVTSVWNWHHSIRSSTVATMPFHSLDVSLFRTVTLGTISLAGAAVLATHAGVGFGFFGVCSWVVVVRRYTPPPITQGGEECV